MVPIILLTRRKANRYRKMRIEETARSLLVFQVTTTNTRLCLASLSFSPSAIEHTYLHIVLQFYSTKYQSRRKESMLLWWCSYVFFFIRVSRKTQTIKKSLIIFFCYPSNFLVQEMNQNIYHFIAFADKHIEKMVYNLFHWKKRKNFAKYCIISFLYRV